MRVLATLILLQSIAYCTAQVPNFVPIEGLISWHSLNGEYVDSFGNHHGENFGAQGTENRFGEPNMAIELDEGDFVTLGTFSEIQGGCEFTTSIWFLPMDQTGSSLYSNAIWTLGHDQHGLYFGYDETTSFDSGMWCGGASASGSFSSVPVSEWHHAVTRLIGGSIELWLDGSLVASQNDNSCLCNHDGVSALGTMFGFPHNFHGQLDNFGVWNRALTEIEIQGLTTETVSGCGDEAACNYSTSVEFDDGTCTFPGCMDLEACNFDETATCSDSSCVYLPTIELPDTLYFCDSIMLDLGSSADLIIWSTEDTASTLMLTESGNIAVTLKNGDAACLEGSGYSHIYDSDSTSFWLSQFPHSWTIANTSADEVGGHLATFSEATEKNQIVSNLNGEKVLFGLFQNANSPDYHEPDGGWEWVTGEPSGFDYWDPAYNEPNNSGGEEVGHLRANGFINDIPAEYNQLRSLIELDLLTCSCAVSHTFVAIKGEAGCTDPEACNFDYNATCDNGLCLYSQPFYNCDSECITDTDGDGVCDELEVEGCMDMDACNFSPETTDAKGTCVYATVIFDCIGECQNDADGNGICDEYESMCGTSYELGFSEGYQEGLMAAQVGQCGPGTIWNSQYQLCMPAEDCVADLSGDGYVGTVDLLLVLSAYGEDCP